MLSSFSSESRTSKYNYELLVSMMCILKKDDFQVALFTQLNEIVVEN